METAAAPQPRELEASRGWTWIQQGFELFKKAPGPWIGTFLIWVVIYAIASILPGGGLLTMLFGDVLIAGWMLGCASLEGGGELKVEHLFAAFKSDQLTQLIVVGALYMAGVFVLFLIVGLVVGGSLMPLLWNKSAVDTTQLGLGVALGILLAIALMVPLMMATWFAPALVIFDRLPPIEAMKLSFNACLRNLVPFLVYGLIGVGILIVAMIPFGLGIIVATPVFIASMYTSYRDVFDRPVRVAATG